jgi:hypothetical protein
VRTRGGKRTSTATAATERPKRQARRAAALKPQKARRARKPVFVEAPAAAPAPKKPRKPRAAKKDAAPARKLDLNAIVSATVGLKAEEAKALLAIVGKLDGLAKSRKGKVVAALNKLFG